FDALAREATTSGKAKGGDDAGWFKARELATEFSKAIASLKPGETSPIVASQGGFAVVKLVSSRTVDDASARNQARADALKKKRSDALIRYTDELKARWVTIDRRLLDAIDLEANTPGIDALKKDQRPLAQVSGEAPVRVSDLASVIEAKFFHGTAQAIA